MGAGDKQGYSQYGHFALILYEQIKYIGITFLGVIFSPIYALENTFLPLCLSYNIMCISIPPSAKY